MLLKAADGLKAGEGPIPHGDRGCRCRWPGLIATCDDGDIVRSMSKKACSPGNVACEAFFRRLKNELFHCRNWRNVDFAEFGKLLDSCIDYCNGSRRKKSSEWMSPVEHRRALRWSG